MKAMILAAGRGERMRPLTDTVHKGLIKIGEHTLIEKHLYALAKIGINEVIINICYLAEQIQQHLGNGDKYNLNIIYSVEAEALETGGGIINALPLLGNEPFILISCDIYTDYPFERLIHKLECRSALRRQSFNSDFNLGHLILVENPSYHPHGDYSLENNYLTLNATKRYTYASMGILHPHLFQDWQPGKRRLTTIFEQAISQQQMTGEIYQGLWFNIGTVEELEYLSTVISHPIR